MANRSLNKVILIGNLTRDPELRYTPSGTAVCTFGVATNRQWVTEAGERKEDAEFHRIVAWQKLAEICGKFLTKGRKVYLEGRLQTRSWTGQDGQQRQTTEIVIDDMIILDSRRAGDENTSYQSSRGERSDVKESKKEEEKEEKPSDSEDKKEEDKPSESEGKPSKKKEKPAKKEDKKEEVSSQSSEENVAADDIPF